MADRQEVDRFASFAERYIIERASTFRTGYEKEDAWVALQDARRVYEMIQRDVALRNGANSPSQQASGGMAGPSPTPFAPVGYAGMGLADLMKLANQLGSSGHKIPLDLRKAITNAGAHHYGTQKA